MLSNLVKLAVVLIVIAALWWAYEAARQYIGRETIYGRVTHVRDGDTIEVSGIPVRLSGITCDELGTPLGAVATNAVRSIVGGVRLRCVLSGEQSYDREIGRCYLPNGADVGALLIARGVCGRCDRYDPLRRYTDEQQVAGPFHGASPGYCWAPW